MKSRKKEVLLPFLLTIILVMADQITKTWIVLRVPVGTIYRSFLNDILWIVHVRNSAIGFSLGKDLPLQVKHVLFIYSTSDSFSTSCYLYFTKQRNFFLAKMGCLWDSRGRDWKYHR